MESPTVVLDTLEAALEWASDRLEEAGIPPGRESNWAMQRRHQAEWMVPALEAMDDHMPPEERTAETCRLLDLGCAYGAFAVVARMLEAEAVGVDWHTPLPAFEAPGLTWERRDIEAPEPLGGPYECVALLEVLEHLHCHPRGLFRRVREALNEGGLFIGSTPDPDTWPEPVPPSDLASMPDALPMDRRPDRHVRLYTPEEVTTLLTEAGFSGITIDRTGAPRYHWRATI